MTIPDFLTTSLPLFSVRVRGEWQKNKIFQVIHGKQIIRDYTVYDGSAKGHLIPFQSKFAAAVWRWQQMSQVEKQPFTSRAAKLGLRISGYNYFISLYLRDKLEVEVGYPDPHHASHEKDGADEIDITGLVGAIAEALIDEKIAAHTAKPWAHPWQRSPLLRYQLRKTETFDLASGENNAGAICFDGTHIWIGLVTSPGIIVKMDPADGTYATYTLASGENYIYSICFDGTHIWVGLYTSPAKIIKMNPADGSYVTYTLASGENYALSICFDGTHIWVGLNTWLAKIIKMNPADGSYVTYTLASGKTLPIVSVSTALIFGLGWIHGWRRS